MLFDPIWQIPNPFRRLQLVMSYSFAVAQSRATQDMVIHEPYFAEIRRDYKKRFVEARREARELVAKHPAILNGLDMEAAFLEIQALLDAFLNCAHWSFKEHRGFDEVSKKLHCWAEYAEPLIVVPKFSKFVNHQKLAVILGTSTATVRRRIESGEYVTDRQSKNCKKFRVQLTNVFTPQQLDKLKEQ